MLYNGSLTPSTTPAATRLRGAVALRRRWVSGLAPTTVASKVAWLVASLVEWLVALLVASLVEWLVESLLLLLLLSGSGMCGVWQHHDLTLGYLVALAAIVGDALHNKVGMARSRVKGRCRVRARGLSVLLLQVVASSASLVSAIFCLSMRLDRCAEQSFLLALCSWPMGLWVVHSREMREGEGEGQLPPCACGPCSTTVRLTQYSC